MPLHFAALALSFSAPAGSTCNSPIGPLPFRDARADKAISHA